MNNEATSNAPVSALSLISTLPVEIFDQIIAEVVTEKRSAIATLMCVSHFWHDAIVQQPLLWATVELDLSRSGDSFSPSYRGARRCIERSGAADLDVALTIRRSKESCACARVFDNCAACSMWISANRAVLTVLAGVQGEHLPRWTRLAVFHRSESLKYRAKWVLEVLAPVLGLGGTPRLRALLLVGYFPGQMVFSQTPLLEYLSFPDAKDVLINDVSRVQKLAFRQSLPARLSSAPFTRLTHLILHIPIFCANLELPNVTTLDLIDNDVEELSLQLPSLPRVHRISIVTYMADFLPQLRTDHYPTWKSFCLQYDPKHRGLPSEKFIEVATAFITSNCTHIEELDIDLWFIDSIKANVQHLPNLKQVLVSGTELERRVWYQSGVSSDDCLIDNTPELGT